jgi:hypothetical protein
MGLSQTLKSPVHGSNIKCLGVVTFTHPFEHGIMFLILGVGDGFKKLVVPRDTATVFRRAGSDTTYASKFGIFAFDLLL